MPIIESYHEALLPILLALVPLAAIAMVVLVFVKEKPLATRVKEEIPAESLAEGQLAPMDLSEDPANAAARKRGD